MESEAVIGDGDGGVVDGESRAAGGSVGGAGVGGGAATAGGRLRGWGVESMLGGRSSGGSGASRDRARRRD